MITLSSKTTKLTEDGINIILVDADGNKYSLPLEVLPWSTNSDEASAFVKQIQHAILDWNMKKQRATVGEFKSPTHMQNS